MEPAKHQPKSKHSGRHDLAVMVDPLTGDDRIPGAGVHIRLPGQRGHAMHPIAQLLPPLMFKQTALDFG
jgi:hypothetical protein